MKTQTKTIGKDLTVFAYSTKQRGYGRQALYQDSVIEALASIFNGDEIKVEEEEEINLY